MVRSSPISGHSTHRVLLRAGAVWILIAFVETVHGTLRTLFAAPILGDLRARQVGVFVGSILILVIARISARWIGAGSRVQRFAAGSLWLALMLAFEVGLGRAFGLSWERIGADYDPSKGGLMLIGMVVILLAPLVTARR